MVQEEGDGWHLWRLEIQRAQEQDQGDYRCQVATHPPLLLDASLMVDGECYYCVRLWLWLCWWMVSVGGGW